MTWYIRGMYVLIKLHVKQYVIGYIVNKQIYDQNYILCCQPKCVLLGKVM